MTAINVNVSESRLGIEDVWVRVRNRRGLMAVLGREASNTLQANFRQLAGKGNKLGAPSTGYWQDAARATQSTVISDNAAVVSVNQVGVRLHYLGGDVVPVEKKWLTIPAIPAAHGKRATEFQNLWVMVKKDQGPIALCRAADNARGFEVVYWLRKSTKHRAEPDTLPLGSTLFDNLRRRAGAYLQREMFKP